MAQNVRFRGAGAKRTLGKLHSTSVSHHHAPSQLPYPPADSLPRSGLVQEGISGSNQQYMVQISNAVRPRSVHRIRLAERGLLSFANVTTFAAKFGTSR